MEPFAVPTLVVVLFRDLRVAVAEEGAAAGEARNDEEVDDDEAYW